MAEIPNPIQVQKFLKGVDYPVNRQQIVDTAKRQGADENVMQALQRLPERQYNGPNAVAEEIGKLS
jgi:Protein of unknown function (DUF2795)